MESIPRCYLYTFGLLVSFFLIIILYLKYVKGSQFKNLSQPDYILFEDGPPQREPLPTIKRNPPVYERDSRFTYSYLPPVNPNVNNAIQENVIPIDPDLYTIQPYVDETLLDVPVAENTNQLVYSGGNTQMITIPLQENYPYNEALRTQKVLITPYNKIKYGNC